MNSKPIAGMELRREQAIALRVKGWTYTEIAEELGTCKSTAFKDVQACIRESIENRREDADAVRALELKRIDAATRVCMKFLTDENENPDDPEKSKELRLKTIDRIAKLNDQRSKMLGLYAPQEIRSTVTEEVSPQDIKAALKSKFGLTVAPEIEDAEASDNTDG